MRALLICLLVSCGSPTRAPMFVPAPIAESAPPPAPSSSSDWVPTWPCVVRGERPAATRVTGTIHGIACDRVTGEAAIGTTVVATSRSLVGEQVVITDENGIFVITALPPGEYTMTYYYDNTVTTGRAHVFASEITTVTVQLDPGPTAIDIRGLAPLGSR